MNIKQIIKTQNFIEEAQTLVTDDYETVLQFANKVSIYFKNKTFLEDLTCNNPYMDSDYYNVDYCKNDMELIECFLKSELESIPNYSTIERILNFKNRITNIAETDYDSMLEIIKEIYNGFSGRISFSDSIKALAMFPGSGKSASVYNSLDLNILKGLLINLEIYAESLLTQKDESSTNNNPSNIINITNTNNQNVDIDSNVENVIKNLNEACLSPAEEKKVNELIEQLKDVIKSKETKSSRWNRFKEIIKGIGEFSLQAAQIIAPLVIQAWPK